MCADVIFSSTTNLIVVILDSIKFVNIFTNSSISKQKIYGFYPVNRDSL